MKFRNPILWAVFVLLFGAFQAVDIAWPNNPLASVKAHVRSVLLDKIEPAAQPAIPAVQ